MSPGIAEIYGPSGAGKTTLLLQMLVDHLRTGQEAKVLYMATDKAFPIGRLRQICGVGEEGCCSEVEFSKLALRLLVVYLPDLELQDHFFRYLLLPSVRQHRISMIVCDSVSANFRAAPRDTTTTEALYTMAHVMHTLHAHFGVRVLCTNQISDSFVGVGGFKPSLGLAWTNSISTRILLDRTHLPAGMRRLQIERSCHGAGEDYSLICTESGLKVVCDRATEGRLS